MISFWIAAGLAVVIALGLVALISARPIAVSADPSRAVYRRQLGEIDDLAERGLLGEEERKSAYAEAARRLLGEGDPDAETPSPPGARSFVWGMALLAGVFAIATYLLVGHPSVPDQPYAKRLAEWKSLPPEDLQAPQVIALLENVKKEQGDNPQFLAFLADMQMRVGNPLAAQRNLERSASIAPDNAETWQQLGVVQLDLNEGRMTPRGRQAFQKALALDPKAIAPRFFLADDLIKSGKVTEGVAALRAMTPDLSPEQKTEVDQRMAEAEKGPAQVASADPASNPAIVAMVEGLAERLRSNPNDPEGWVRLANSYRVLNDQAKLTETLTDARRYFKGRPRELQAIEAAARGTP